MFAGLPSLSNILFESSEIESEKEYIELKWKSHDSSARQQDIFFSQEFVLLSRERVNIFGKYSGPESEFKTQFCLREMRLNIQNVLTT